MKFDKNALRWYIYSIKLKTDGIMKDKNKKHENAKKTEKAKKPEKAKNDAVEPEVAKSEKSIKEINAEIKLLKKQEKNEKKEEKRKASQKKKADAAAKKREARENKEKSAAEKKEKTEEKRLLKEKAALEKNEARKAEKEAREAEKKTRKTEKEESRAKEKPIKPEKPIKAKKEKTKREKKKMSPKKKKLTAALCVVLAFVLAASVWYNLPRELPVKPDINKNTVTPETKNAKSVLSDSYGNELFVDEKEGTFYFKNKYSGLLNPFCADAAEYGAATAVSLQLTNKNGDYINLNSTDNSLVFDSFTLEETKNGVIFEYTMYESSESFEADSENGVAARVPFEIYTEDGNFKVAVNMSDVFLADGLVVENISLLPGAFAVDKNAGDAYYIVPDGSGCVVDLFARPGDEKSVAFPVYNSNISSESYSSGALIPYYSYSDGKCLTTAVIDGGDALATIYYDTKADGTCLLYSVFNVTPTVRSERFVNFGASYTGEVSVVLDFKSGDDGAYNEAAFFVREFFVKKGYLRDSVDESTGDLPFIITVIGSADGKDETLYTTFEEAEEMVTLLNSKGVRSVWLRFSGALSKGLLQSGVSYRSLNSALGGKKDFLQLKSTADEKNSKVFLEADVLAGNGANALGKGDIRAFTYADLDSYTKSYSEKKTLGNESVLRSNTSSFYKLLGELDNADASLNDLSFLLYSSDTATRADALLSARSAAGTVSADSTLMLSHPALYLLKYATAVSNVPTSYETLDGSGLHAVPFLQEVIHGSVIYGCDYVNNGDLWNTMLKTVEYGGVASFLFTYGDCEGLAYGNYASIAAQYYSKIKSLKAIADMRITSHEEIKSGIYKIVYNYNRVVYVNYTTSVAEIEGVLLSPQDFLIV